MKKNNEKKLALNKSTLANLSSSQMSNVVGGMLPIRYTTQNIECKTDVSTCAKQCC